MNAKIFLMLVPLAVAAYPVTAQTPASHARANILKGSEVTESALIDALEPPPTSRGFSRDAGGKPSPKARNGGQASLLIEFQTNSTRLTPDAKQQLDVVGRALNTNKLAEYNFVLEGHADPRGSRELNQKLSEGRAGAVREYLVENQKVKSGRLKTVGKGDREPLNVDNPAAPENRRVTILTLTN